MIKKLLFSFLLFFMSVFVYGQDISFTTTSNNGAWSPSTVTNSGATLVWTATGGGITDQTDPSNDPTFDLSQNTGTVTITASSSDGFIGLTRLYMPALGLSSANVSNATSLTRLYLYSNQLTSLDISQNIALISLRIQGGNSISALDVSSNPLLTDLRVQDNALPSSELDGIVNTLAGFNETDGNLQISGNAGGLTTGALAGWTTLDSNFWTIDVSAPVSDTEPPVIGVLNTPTNVLQTSLTLTWTAATDNVGVANYNIFQDNVLIATVGNVLTYDVTGLTTDTNYDFYITALDNESNESSPSNVQNITTAPLVSTLVFTTTSNSGTWSPSTVSNSGATLTWSATGGGIVDQTDPSNDPTFDLSQNTGTVTITASSSDGFVGLTRLYMQGLNLISADLASATSINRLYLFSNQLTSINIDQNVALTSLRLHGGNSIVALDVSNNPLLIDLRVQDNALPSGQLDAIVNDLAGFNETDGNLQISGNAGSLTSASSSGYTTLENNFWTIDVLAPVSDTEPPVIGVLNTPTNVLQTSLTLTWTAATDNVGVTNYNIFQDNVLLATVGNVLTYDVTGLTADTNYDFYITALDNESNESSSSNVQNVTTNPLVTTLVFTTTSNSGTWSPSTVTNSGTTLTWSATGGGIVDQTDPSNDPTFDLSQNTGTVTITASSSDGFIGLTRLYMQGLELSSANIGNATSVDRLYLFSNQLTSLNIDQNVALSSLRLHGGNSIAALDVSNNPLLIDLRVQDNALPSGQLDAIVNDLAGFNETDGNLQILGNAGNLTSASSSGYTTLENNFWTIDVSAPVTDTEPPVIGVLNTPTNVLQTSLTLTWTAATDNIGVTNYNVFQDNVLIATLGNVLTYDVTGLTADTNYDFYITALDNESNESSSSNVQNITTIPLVSTLVFTTTSTSGTWSPSTVANSGTTLTWSATGGGIVDQTDPSNDPTFDLSQNTGTVTITAESTDGFIGLSRLYMQGLNLISADLTSAISINRLYLFSNQLTSLNIDQNVALTSLRLHGGNSIAALDVSNNPLLIDLRVQDNALPSGQLDAIVNDLAGFNETDGNLQISGNAGSLTSASSSGYTTLENNFWNIDVTAPPAGNPDINITGNGLDISSSNAAISADGTDFGATTIGAPLTNQFTIENNGGLDLILTLFLPTNPAEFAATTPANMTIPAGGSETFDVTFGPLSLGPKSGSVIIQSNDPDTAVFVLNFAGEGVSTLPNQIMISQYYDGFSGADDWIEVSNISGVPIPANTYFLALYDQNSARTGIIESQVPDQNTPIPALAVGETILFKNIAASVPTAGNLGGATQIDSDVCNFNGDDVILISTSNTTDSYNSRVEIIGNVSSGPTESPDPWGFNQCYIKGGCSSESAHTTFDINDWNLVAIDDVDNANPTTNIALGTQVVGPTTFDGVSWSNGEPDQSRTAIISGSFTGAVNSITSCNLVINPGVNVVFDSDGVTSNSIVLYGDLVVDGSLTIGDTESLVVYDAGATLGTITKIEKSTVLDNINDVTYWASPVEGSQLTTIFAGVDQSRIFDFRAGNENPVYAGTNFKYWWVSSGAMGRAKGYAAPGVSTGVQTLSFTGIPHNGTWVTNLWYSGSADIGLANENFNMIGNPYPAAIDILKVMEDNGNVNEIALWTHGTEVDPGTGEYYDGDYVYFNLAGDATDGVTKNISSSQGFMIRTIAGGSFNINNSHLLIGQNEQFFKDKPSKSGENTTKEGDKIWLRLVSGTEKSDIMVGFMEEATDGYDKFYDAIGNLYDSNISLIEKNTKFYSKIKGDKFVIQELSKFDGSKKVNLGFDTKKTGWMKISINKKQGALAKNDVYLIDTYLNIKHDLNRSAYEFEAASSGEFPDRFRLEFIDNDLDLSEDILDQNEFMVTNNFDVMKIKSGKSVNEIKVFDLLGRMIIKKAPNQKSFELNTSSVKIGTVMLIEARLKDGTLLNTKSIKY